MDYHTNNSTNIIQGLKSELERSNVVICDSDWFSDHAPLLKSNESLEILLVDNNDKEDRFRTKICTEMA